MFLKGQYQTCVPHLNLCWYFIKILIMSIRCSEILTQTGKYPHNFGWCCRTRKPPPNPSAAASINHSWAIHVQKTWRLSEALMFLCFKKKRRKKQWNEPNSKAPSPSPCPPYWKMSLQHYNVQRWAKKRAGDGELQHSCTVWPKNSHIPSECAMWLRTALGAL